MKLPADLEIAPEKLTRYLLVNLPRNDKSKFLARAGYGQSNWGVLLADLRRLAADADAEHVETNKFGDFYSVRASITGPNGVSLRVNTVWMTEHLSGITKFITLIPDETP
ncbi:MAG TPA: hypothetical protein VMM36_06505 [Opitutaceae bacterium]|nr:hypothetical protein [Opitutaceae bacterium]